MSDTMPNQVYRWCQGCVDRDAEIATLRERLAAAEAERAGDKAEIARWREVVAQGTEERDGLRTDLAASRALADRLANVALRTAHCHTACDGCRDAARAALKEWEEARRG